MNILHLCSSQGYIKHVQHVIAVAEKHLAVRDYVDSITTDDKYRCTALFFAIRMGHGGFFEIINILVRSGCGLDILDADGFGALHYASELGQDDTLELMVQFKANVDIQARGSGKTPLHLAIENGQFNSVMILCEQGKADVNIVDTINGDSLLHYAAVGQGNASLYIKYLVDKCKMSVMGSNKQRLTPRQHA